jgi:alkylation response protein AidB-like acyl-CoA dehydrogenase
MDFSLTEEQTALAELAGKILTDHCTLERLKRIEQTDERYDRALWGDLAKAGLLGVAVPEPHGGSGHGLIELCLLLEQQGRRVAMVPLLPTLLAAALPIARFGSEPTQQRYLPGVAAGEVVLTAALTEQGADSRSPATTAAADGTGWRLRGVKTMVPFAHLAAAVVIPARLTDGRIGVFLVDPKSSGVTLARQEAMNWEAQFRMDLTDVYVGSDSLLGSVDAGAEILGWIIDRVTVGLCAIQAGVCQVALQTTAEYASNRKQFDKPIAMFQAVGQRMADSYIDNEAVGLTMWQAATLLAEESSADKEIATAKFWAAEGGSRIGHAALHIHGGISIDVDYPIHRYFLWAKQIEYTLGAATEQLVRLGELLAADPVG